MFKKDRLATLVKNVLNTEAGRELLAELYTAYADNIPRHGRDLVETGVAIGKAELVKDLFRIVHGKLSDGIKDVKISKDDLDYYGE